MPSRQSRAVRDMYRSWTSARLAGRQGDTESWGDLTREPRGVDYFEVDAGGVPAMWAVPKARAGNKVLLCLHGGGFVSGSIYTHRKLYATLAKAVGARALLVDYRLAPTHVHPAPLDDVVTAYRWLLGQEVEPFDVAFAGDSSGGGLAVTAQLRARDLGIPLPAAAVLFSPWVDMEVDGASYEANRTRDAFFYREVVVELATTFLGAHGDPRDPLANPLYADLRGLAPMLIQAGGDETLLDDARNLDAHARLAEVDSRLEVFAAMQHTFQMAAGRVPESDEALRAAADWLRGRLGEYA